jgi:hypothetical protein
MRAVIFPCILLLSAGCFFGDRAPERRAVSVSLLASEGHGDVGLSVDAPEVQEVLKIVDTELIPRGYVRDEKAEGTRAQDLIASYAQRTSTGHRLLGGPTLYLSDGYLVICFSAGGGMGSRISPETERIIESLRDTLSRRYGSDRVKIKR